MKAYTPTGLNLIAEDRDNASTRYNQKYYVTQDGHAITEPMTAADIVAKFGAIRELESNGFKVVPA